MGMYPVCKECGQYAVAQRVFGDNMSEHGAIRFVCVNPECDSDVMPIWYSNDEKAREAFEKWTGTVD